MTPIKRVVLLFVLFFITIVLNGQRFTVAVERPVPVVYVGLDNWISCTVEIMPCDSVFLTTDNGRIHKVGCNSYLYNPVVIGDSKLNVCVKKNNEVRVIGNMQVRVRNIPDPSAAIGGLTGGSIGKKNLAAQAGVASFLTPSIGIDIMYMVVDFQFTIIRKDSVIYSEKNTGPAFSDSIKNTFNQLMSGDRVMVSAINVIKADGRIVLIKPLEFLITE